MSGLAVLAQHIPMPPPLNVWHTCMGISVILELNGGMFLENYQNYMQFYDEFLEL